MEGKRYTPHEFLKYIREPLSQDDIDLWIKAHGLTLELSTVFFDFVNSLYVVVNKTYLGVDVIKNTLVVINIMALKVLVFVKIGTILFYLFIKIWGVSQKV